MNPYSDIDLYQQNDWEWNSYYNYCPECDENAAIETKPSRIGLKWICHWCGAMGTITTLSSFIAISQCEHKE